MAEIPATRVRAQTVVLARTCYILSQAALQQLFPRFLTPKPDGWDIGGKCGFLFVGINIILVFYCFYRLPETMGRTFGEIDILFQNRVTARLFKSTVVDGKPSAGESCSLSEFEADRVQEPFDLHGGLEIKETQEVTHSEYQVKR